MYETDSHRRPFIRFDHRKKINGTIPNVLMAGVQKSGSSAVGAYLQNWTCFAMSISDPNRRSKEVHYFDHLDKKDFYWYQSRFRHCSNERFGSSSQNHVFNQSAAQLPLIVDATPRYFLYPQEIHDLYQNLGLLNTLKIVIVLREPMARELSYYHMCEFNIRKRKEPIKGFFLLRRFTTKENYTAKTDRNGRRILPSKKDIMTFQEYVNKVFLPRAKQPQSSTNRLFGFYAHWLEKWFELFDRQQIWVVNYDEIRFNQTSFLQRLHSFLGLPPLSGVAGDDNSSYNDTIQDSDLDDDNVGVSSSSDDDDTVVDTTAASSSSPVPAKLPTSNYKHLADEDKPSCYVQLALYQFFASHNKRLYQLLEENPGPSVETRPFRRFRFDCRN
ncbi:hypothetical protein ACA910_019001 [Epithemia clementina (nom. ined.)]